MKAIHTLRCRELCNLLPTVYPTSKTQVSLAPTSTCYVNCLNTRKVLNCIFRSKVKSWLQVMFNYRPCFINMNKQAIQHLHSTGIKSSYGKMYSERLRNINKHFHLYLFNPLTPNGLYSGRAVSPLNSRMAIIEAANSVSKFGAILFTPIRFSAVVCYVLGPRKVMLCFRTQNVPPHKHQYRCRLSNCTFFST
jgi:hypothetical protein